MVQLSIRTKSFYLKLAQSYIFSLFIFVLNTIIYYRTYWFTFLQIVNIFLSIVCKPKRFLFCMFLFVVKWWEIPLEGSLVMCKWRAIRLLPAQEPVSIVFCEAFHLQENPFHPRTNPLWLSHHERKKKAVVSAGSSTTWKSFHLFFLVTNHFLPSRSWTLSQIDGWKDSHSLGNSRSDERARTSKSQWTSDDSFGSQKTASEQ